MAKLSDLERRALEEIASHPDGCAEATLLADGFTIEHLSGPLIGGFATIERRRADVDGLNQLVLWMQITDAGCTVPHATHSAPVFSARSLSHSDATTCSSICSQRKRRSISTSSSDISGARFLAAGS
jgi:hypothetical protein